MGETPKTALHRLIKISPISPSGASQCMLFEPVVRYGTDCPNTGY
ncbi:hypothetical protein [Moorena sp. SIO4G3]|nr:hypothetical protein [Moorena sp. SIO4G3]